MADYRVYWTFGLRPSRAPHLDSLRSPFGPAFGCYSASLRFFACPRKVCQRRAPGIRVSLRETSLATVPLRGSAYKGHPWPIKWGRHRYLAASMRLVPLRNTYARPSDGTGSRACEISTESSSAASVFAFALKAAIAQTTPKSPSGGRVESPRKGLSDMDVARATMGQGWPFVACPWSGDGRREPRRSRGRMVGCPSLWLLSLGQARATQRSGVTAAG